MIKQLFTTYFISNNKYRQKEIDICIKNNIQNPSFQKIHIFLDDNTEEKDLTNIFSEELQFWSLSHKINIIKLDHVPTYKDWLIYSLKYEKDYISILCNADIYFDKTIENINQFLLEPNNLVLLSRYEDLETEIVPHSNPLWSQDVWAINTKYIENIEFLNDTKIQLGKCRCDNKFAYFFAINNWNLFNPIDIIKCYHKHCSNHRTYNRKDQSIKGALAFVHPSHGNETSKIELCVMPLSTKNITKISLSSFLQN